MLVVDELEIVEVGRDQSYRTAGAGATLRLGRELVEEAATVREPGQRIGHRLALRNRVLTRVFDGDGRLRGQTLCSLALELAEAADRRIEERDRLAGRSGPRARA